MSTIEIHEPEVQTLKPVKAGGHRCGQTMALQAVSFERATG
jgi:hypothetical protein